MSELSKHHALCPRPGLEEVGAGTKASHEAQLVPPAATLIPFQQGRALTIAPSPLAGTQVSFPKSADAFAFEEDSSNDGLSPEQARSEDSPGSTESAARSKAPEPPPAPPAEAPQVGPRAPCPRGAPCPRARVELAPGPGGPQGPAWRDTGLLELPRRLLTGGGTTATGSQGA